MKVSTQQFFDKSLGHLQKAQSDAAKSNEQLSTGKSLVRASDDTLKLRAVANLDRAITAIDNRNSNVELLLSRFSLEESILRSASDVTARIRELAIQSSNATYSAQDRKLMGAEVASLRDHLLALANTKDSEGGSLFGGSRTSTDPFIEASDGKIIYQGNEEVMKVEVGENRFLSKNRGGLQVFAGVIRVDNQGEEKKVGFFDVIDDFVTSLTSPKKTQITVSEDELSTNTGQLTINGVEISKTEDKLDIDEIVRRINLESGRTNVSSFKNEAGDIVIENADGFEGENIEFGEAPGVLLSIRGVIRPSEDSRLWERGISELGIIHDELSFAIGRAGSEMNSAEYQKELNLDAEVRLKQLKSSQVDVDFAEVVSRFNAELARLEASQAAFAKLSRMSLFEYL